MRFATFCSGIGAPETAWEPLGWTPVYCSEIEPFPCAVLAHRFPKVPNIGDMTKVFTNEIFINEPIDLICGGTPCQGFSIAGLRGGLDDPRSQLSLTFGRIAAEKRPRWILWENVPGVLSSNGGRDFAEFLGFLSGQGIEPPKGGWKKAGIIPGYRNAYGLAWRVLDAQYFGVAQRRERVFVVGYLGDWRHAAAVLFDAEGCAWHPAPGRKTGQDPSCFAASSIGAYIETEVGGTVRANGGDLGGGSETLCFGGGNTSGPLAVRHAATAKGQRNDFEVEVFAVSFGAIPINTQVATRHISMGNGTGFGVGEDGDPAFTITTSHSHAVAYFDGVQITSKTNRSTVEFGDSAGTLSSASLPHVITSAHFETSPDQNMFDGLNVRRLTPQGV